MSGGNKVVAVPREIYGECGRLVSSIEEEKTVTSNAVETQVNYKRDGIVDQGGPNREGLR